MVSRVPEQRNAFEFLFGRQASEVLSVRPPCRNVRLIFFVSLVPVLGERGKSANLRPSPSSCLSPLPRPQACTAWPGLPCRECPGCTTPRHPLPHGAPPAALRRRHRRHPGGRRHPPLLLLLGLSRGEAAPWIRWTQKVGEGGCRESGRES